MSKSEPRKVHIAEVRKVRNGITYTSVYLRRTFREDGMVKHETLGNLSDLPRDLIELMRTRLAQGEPLSGVGEQMIIQRSLPHGNVEAHSAASDWIKSSERDRAGNVISSSP